MAATIIEKIIASHGSGPASAGDFIWLTLDVRSARDFGGANVVKSFEQHYKGEKVDDPARTIFTFDCNAPANTIPYAENQRTCRRFAKEQGIRVYDVDRGIGSHVLIEEGLVAPGSTVVGTDSHLNIMGAVGAFGQGMGDADIAYIFRWGRNWFEVPPTVKVTLKGVPSRHATARDITFAVMKHFGSSGALGKVVEVYGHAIDEMDLAGRITLASQGTETGAISIIIPPTHAILHELHMVTGRKFEPIAADHGAAYEEEIVLDVSGLGSLVAAPPSPANIKEVSELPKTPVDAVFVGSCTNGRYEDIKAFADIMRGNRVHPGVNTFVVPATSQVYGRLLSEGVIADLFKSGVLVSNPSCAGCASGQIGMTGTGEVMLSTSNRNFKGKQGNGQTYLVSPVTAALGAITGHLTSTEREGL